MEISEIRAKYAIDDATMLARIKKVMNYPHLLDQLVAEIKRKGIRLTAEERDLINSKIKERNDKIDASRSRMAKRMSKSPGGWIV